MAKTKKVRSKKYQPKEILLPSVSCAPEVLAALRELLTECRAASEIKLPNGTADGEDILAVRDTLSWFGVLIAGCKTLNPEEVAWAKAVQKEAVATVNLMIAEGEAVKEKAKAPCGSGVRSLLRTDQEAKRQGKNLKALKPIRDKTFGEFVL